jgi:hypothetical protein
VIDRETRILGAATEAAAEAARALEKHGPENTMDAPSKTDGERLAILIEEAGEVAKELTYDHAGVQLVSTGERPDPWVSEVAFIGNGKVIVTDPDGHHERWIEEMDDEELRILGYRRISQQERLRKELIQTAAMALTWAAMLP